MILAVIFTVVIFFAATSGLAAPMSNQSTSAASNPYIQAFAAGLAAPSANQPSTPPSLGADQSAQPAKIVTTAPVETQNPVVMEQKPAEMAGQTQLFGARPRVVRLKYLKAEQAKGLLVLLISEDRIKVEPVNNNLVVMVDDDEFSNIKAMLAEVDVPPQQVMFEVEAVEINYVDAKIWGLLGNADCHTCRFGNGWERLSCRSSREYERVWI